MNTPPTRHPDGSGRPADAIPPGPPPATWRGIGTQAAAARATLPTLPPRQAAPEETVLDVTRDAAGGRTPAANREPAAAAFVMRRLGT